MTTLPAAVIGIAISVFMLYICYFKTIWQKVAAISEQSRNEAGITPACEGEDAKTESFSVLQRRLVLSRDRSVDPFETSQITESFSELHAHMQDEVTIQQTRNRNSNRFSKSAPPSPHCQRLGLPRNLSADPIEKNQATESFNGLHTSMENEVSRNSTYGSIRPIQQNRNLSNRFSKSAPDSLDLIDSPVATAQEETKSRSLLWKKGIFITWLIAVTTVVVILLAIPPLPEVEFNLGLVPVGAAVF